MIHIKWLKVGSLESQQFKHRTYLIDLLLKSYYCDSKGRYVQGVIVYSVVVDEQLIFNSLSANPTKWSNILWGWHLKG